MKIEQIYTGCLAHAAYYLESNGEAAIFDPLREVDPYIKRAKLDDPSTETIRHLLETRAGDIPTLAWTVNQFNAPLTSKEQATWMRPQ